MTDLSELIPDWKGLSVDEIVLRLAEIPKDARDEIVSAATQFTEGMKWLPQIGPQTECFFSPADVTLFGGEAGGGKSSMGIGLALTAHKRSLLLREQYVELDFLIEETLRFNGTRAGFNGSNPPSLRTTDGRFLQFAGGDPDKVMGWMGTPFDYKFFDEAVNFQEKVIRFHIGWLRSAEPSQRTRVLLASNPPISSKGDWIIPMFGPWLDITHPNPAKPGELRWFATDPDGNDFEVPGPELYQFPGQEKPVRPMSRTFIRSRLADNRYYADSGYDAKLDAMPEPMRSAFRDGNFMASRADQEHQVIPTDWIIQANKRWRKEIPDVTMTAIAADVGAGGIDRVVLSARYGEWYAPLVTVAGKDAPDGSAQAALIVKHRRDMCGIVVDVGGGYGGDCIGRLKANQIEATKFDGSAGSSARAKDGSGRVFINRRAEAWWRFREALNPDQPGGSLVALPDDPELRAELSAVQYIPDISKIQIESKIDVKKRLGRSPDKADAVVMAWGPGDTAIKRVRFGGGMSGSDRPTTQNIGFSDLKRFGR